MFELHDIVEATALLGLVPNMARNCVRAIRLNPRVQPMRGVEL
jgi:hypothetical protein